MSNNDAGAGNFDPEASIMHVPDSDFLEDLEDTGDILPNTVKGYLESVAVTEDSEGDVTLDVATIIITNCELAECKNELSMPIIMLVSNLANRDSMVVCKECSQELAS